MTTSTRYVIRHRTEPRPYYSGVDRWVPAIEHAAPFEFMSVADGFAIMRLGLTEMDYTVELIAVVQ